MNVDDVSLMEKDVCWLIGVYAELGWFPSKVPTSSIWPQLELTEKNYKQQNYIYVYSKAEKNK